MGLLDKLDIRALIPLIDIDIDDSDGKALATPHGLGDMAAMLRYQFLNTF